MGQIFRRLNRIVSSYINDNRNSGSSVLNNEDEELRRIIEELKYTGKKQEKQKQSEPEDDRGAMTADRAYRILGIDADSDAAAIKSAYKKRMTEYHPDRVENLGEEIRILAKQKSQQINEAYNFLKRNKGF
jgi:DnaJ-domain-containing protein 1